MAPSNLSWVPYVYVPRWKFNGCSRAAGEYKCACILCEEVPVAQTGRSNNCFCLYSDHVSFWGRSTAPPQTLPPLVCSRGIIFNALTNCVYHVPHSITTSAVTLLRCPKVTLEWQRMMQHLWNYFHITRMHSELRSGN